MTGLRFVAIAAEFARHLPAHLAHLFMRWVLEIVGSFR